MKKDNILNFIVIIFLLYSCAERKISISSYIKWHNASNLLLGSTNNLRVKFLGVRTVNIEGLSVKFNVYRIRENICKNINGKQQKIERNIIYYHSRQEVDKIRKLLIERIIKDSEINAKTRAFVNLIDSINKEYYVYFCFNHDKKDNNERKILIVLRDDIIIIKFYKNEFPTVIYNKRNKERFFIVYHDILCDIECFLCDKIKKMYNDGYFDN